MLLGKYESNNTGLQLILTYFDQIIEAYDIVNNLLESEMGLLLASCRAAGLGKIGLFIQLLELIQSFSKSRSFNLI